jgi:hypothetical protein
VYARKALPFQLSLDFDNWAGPEEGNPCHRERRGLSIASLAMVLKSTVPSSAAMGRPIASIETFWKRNAMMCRVQTAAPPNRLCCISVRFGKPQSRLHKCATNLIVHHRSSNYRLPLPLYRVPTVSSATSATVITQGAQGIVPQDSRVQYPLTSPMLRLRLWALRAVITFWRHVFMDSASTLPWCFSLNIHQ